IVSLLEGDEGADARWRLTLRGADQLLDDLGFDLDGKHAIMARARESMGREFHVDTAMQKQIGARFRAERAALMALVERDPGRDAEHELAPGFAALERRSSRLGELGAE